VKPLWAADSIGRRFGERTILSSASVWAYPGRITALFGRNGSGKSTLLRIGAGLMRADHGTVRYDGRVYLRPSLARMAGRGLFFIPADGLLCPRMTLREHLEAVRRCIGGVDPRPLAERLGLGPLLDAPTRTLSGGERRLGEMLVAAARRPRCLLADEPFAGVTPAAAEKAATLLREMAAEGCAIVVTGHEVRQVMAVADDVVWLTAGTTHHLGTPESARTNHAFRREYLGFR
jgi:ABC-type multidrug transport system ATPase subunit